MKESKLPVSFSNLKLVMNPEGKLHDWTDLPEEEVPDELQVAVALRGDVVVVCELKLQLRGGEVEG